MLAQSVHANNLANLSNDGFRRDFVQARSMGVYYGDGLPTRAYAMAETPVTDFSHGSIRETGREMDVIVRGEGWIAVQAPDGREAYTRAGNLQVTPLGELVTSTGLPVLGNGGPIAVPPSEKIQIGTDGSITLRTLGQRPEALAQVERIKLVKLSNEELEKGADGLIYSKFGGNVVADPSVRLATGFVEGSNINAVEAMTEMLTLARQYEMHVKVMSTIDQVAESATQILRSS